MGAENVTSNEENNVFLWNILGQLYPAALTVHHFPFFDWDAGKCYMVSNEFQVSTNALHRWHHQNSANFQFGFQLNSNDLIWSSTDNFKFFTEYKPATGYSDFVNAPQVPFDLIQQL